jgi:hypothetical protein
LNIKASVQSEDFIPTLTHAIERDIDLLLVEELKCDFEFVAWVVSHLPTGSLLFDKIRVLHSKRRTLERREIDIQVELFETGSEQAKAILLIENKIDEKEQPGQGISYGEEKLFLHRDGRAEFLFSILLCPEAYSSAWPAFAAQFDTMITYELIEQFFHERSASLRGELAARLAHRAELMSQAITKRRRGYQPIPISKIGSFNERYVTLLSELAPEIFPGRGLKRRDDKPSDSVSMIYDCQRSFAGLLKQIVPSRFAHELGRGREHRANYVNVQFRGFDRGFERLSQRDKDEIESDGLVVEAKLDRRSGKKTLKLEILTPAVDNQAPFDRVKAEVTEGIQAAVRLRNWCFNHEKLLAEISHLSTV